MLSFSSFIHSKADSDGLMLFRTSIFFNRSEYDLVSIKAETSSLFSIIELKFLKLPDGFSSFENLRTIDGFLGTKL